MSRRAQLAKEYLEKGYACSQAVALAFADIIGLPETQIAKIMLPFGGGFGRLRLVCGAISGMTAVIGLIFSGEENSPENKKNVYAIEQTLCGRFKEKYGTLICGELLEGMKVPVEVGGVAEPRTQEYYKKRSCGEIVYDVAQILDDYLQEKGVY